MFPIFFPIFMPTPKAEMEKVKDERPFTKKVYKFLRKHSDEAFSASDIAEAFSTRLPLAIGAVNSLFQKELVKVEEINGKRCYKYKTTSFENEIKIKAYKDFTERLKEMYKKESCVSVSDIDNLLNEMIGEEE